MTAETLSQEKAESYLPSRGMHKPKETRHCARLYTWGEGATMSH